MRLVEKPSTAGIYIVRLADGTAKKELIDKKKKEEDEEKRRYKEDVEKEKNAGL